MKFYGIDMQAKFLIEEASSPSWVASDDRRFVRDSDTNRVYIGTTTTFSEMIQDMNYSSTSWPTNFKTGLDATYHPKNGTVSESITASTYVGDGSGTLRISDKWVKLSDNTSLVAGNTAGIRIESGSTVSDSDDILLYYNYDTGKWSWYDGATTYTIASEAFASGSLVGALDDYWLKTEIDARFVRFSDAGDGSSNTTWSTWNKLITTTTLADGRYYYTKQEAHDGFVRVTDWAVNTPDSSPKYASTSSIAWTIAQRDGSADLYCNILHGVATSAQYADLAERYTCDEDLPVGTVVEVVNDTDTEVDICMFELSPSVVGVVSSNPAFMMNSRSAGLPIALTGKVPVRVVGEIKKGDFIVPAGNGLARAGDPSELIFKMGISLATDLQIEEKLIECIIK